MNGILNKLAIIEIEEVENSKNQGDLQTSVVNILNAVIGVLSFVCVVVIIIGGVTYMTSSGDTSKVKKAKDTILYGVIGLAVCVLAFAIVNFVISNILNG
jgi:TRAP-type C4-dicarboxylate transport system permease small subunit